MTGERGRTLPVILIEATTIVSGQTGAAITLTNGQSVLVDGTFDIATQKLTATSVTLLDYTTYTRERVKGTVASVNADAKSLVLTIVSADGVQPTGGTIIVQTDASTHFGKGRRQSVTLSDIAVGGSVEAEGTFDATSQTLTARSVHLR